MIVLVLLQLLLLILLLPTRYMFLIIANIRGPDGTGIIIILALDSGVHKGGFSKGGSPMYVFTLCDCNTSGSVFNVEIENVPNC